MYFFKSLYTVCRAVLGPFAGISTKQKSYPGGSFSYILCWWPA
jgi:hypothetical protein